MLTLLTSLSVRLTGPKSQAVLQQYVDVELSTLYFGQSTFADFTVPGAGASGAVRIHIARGGYTGEDGFEVSIPPEDTVAVTDALVRTPLEGADGSAVELIGLGARDSLRLEAGMCLYGHDLNEGINPVEAGLAWVISQSSLAFWPAKPRLPPLTLSRMDCRQVAPRSRLPSLPR